MTRRISLVVSLALSLLSLTTSLASQQGLSIAGVVVDASDGVTPVRRAIVTATGSAASISIAAVTDDRGRFTLTNLAPGRLSLSARKAGYVTTEHGAKRAGRPGTPLTLDAGGNLTDVRLSLSKGGVIAGTVLTETGEAAAGVTVSIAGVRGSQAIRRPEGSSSWTTTTDAEGAYRFFGLPAGDYVAAVVVYRTINQVVRLPPGEIDRRLSFLGEKQLPGRPPPADVPVSPSQVLSYAPRYYANATSSADATRIRIDLGTVREGIDLVASPALNSVVSGTVTTPDGTPPTSTVLSLTPVGPALQISRQELSAESAAQDGTYRFSRVPAGRYLLVARKESSAAADTLWATAHVDVRDGAGMSVDVMLKRPPTLSGQLVLEGSDGKRVALPTNGTNILVRLLPGSTDGSSTVFEESTGGGTFRQPATMRQPDGSFTVSGVLPGTYLPSAENLPKGFWLRSVMLNGRDLLDFPVTVDGSTSDIADVTFTVTDRHSELSGVLEEREGRPGTDYFVVVIPRDETLWRTGARRMRSVRPATDGHYELRDLPGGDYLLAALVDFDPEDFADRSFLQELARFAVPVTIRDGERTTQNLRVAR